MRDIGSSDHFVSPRPPYISQFASKELVSDILDRKRDPTSDPRWREFGFTSPRDYTFWSWRACGVISMKMVLDAYGVASGETVATLIERAVDFGGYEVRGREGNAVDEGWFYGPLVELAKEFGIDGEVHRVLSDEVIRGNVIDDRFTVASVHPGVIRSDFDHTPAGADGGHLVLVWGCRWTRSECAGYYIQNPSGRVRETQDGAFIPIARFREAFASRGFSLYRRQS